MSIRKRRKKDGKYSYQVRVLTKNGTWISETFLTRRDAELFELKIKSDIYNNTKIELQITEITLNEFWEHWSANCRHRVSDGWKYTQNQMYRDYIKPLLGHYQLASINGADISQVFTYVKKTGRSAQTILHVYNLLNKILSDACNEYDYISKNPVKRSHKPDLPRKEASYLKPDEAAIFLRFVKNKPFGMAFWLQIFCGLRIGEVQVLQWKNVDFERKVIAIRATYCRKTDSIQDYPKGRKWHYTAIPGELYDYLLEEYKNKNSEYVVSSSDGSILCYYQYYNDLKRYCRKLKLERSISTHSLRHSTSLIYQMCGATRDDLQALFAHSSGKVTDRYIHDFDFRMQNIENIANKINLLQSLQ